VERYGARWKISQELDTDWLRQLIQIETHPTLRQPSKEKDLGRQWLVTYHKLGMKWSHVIHFCWGKKKSSLRRSKDQLS
jgi:hypothetical protein